MLPGLLLAAILAQAPAKKQIAVLDFESAGVPAELTETASLLVPTEVRKNAPNAQVISGAEIRSMIGFERQKQLLGCADEAASCMAELGGALGADELVAGKIGKLGTTYVLELRRIDVKQARPIRSMTRIIERDSEFVSAIVAGVSELYSDGKPSASRGGGLRGFAWIPAAGAAVAGGVGAFALIQANKNYETLIGNSPSPVSPEKLRDDGRTYQAIGNIAVGVTVAAAGVAVLMYVTGAPDDAAGETKVVAGAFELTTVGVRW